MSNEDTRASESTDGSLVSVGLAASNVAWTVARESAVLGFGFATAANQFERQFARSFVENPTRKQARLLLQYVANVYGLECVDTPDDVDELVEQMSE